MTQEMIYTLKSDPSQIISAFDLVYTTPEILKIARKKRYKTFHYFREDKRITDQDKIKQYNSLAIPPAWQDVKISYIDNAHILAVGYDEKTRKQYIYNPQWTVIKNQTKFFKMIGFAENLPKLRKRVIEDLKQKKWTQTKVLAIVIKLLEESHIRIGNSYYEKRNKTYGLSTLRTRHLSIFKDKFKLEFTGKRGKEHSVTIKNKKLLRLINQCEEIPGWKLFQYYDENGNKQDLDSTMINNYIHDTCGELYSAKDFRTWSASLIAFDTLMDIHHSKDLDMEKDKAILKAIDTASEALNNTRSVCRKYYVHPHVTESYEKNTIQPYFDMVDTMEKSLEYELQPNEKALLALIETYEPTLISK